MRHTVAVLVLNEPGVLTRVAGLFARRGYNIESLAVGVTENPNVSRMTIVAEGDERVLEQLCKQLNKLIHVLKVQHLPDDEAVARELALIKVNAEPAKRAQILQIVDIFRAKVVDIGRRSMIVEITGDSDKIDALVQLLAEFGIVEAVRTGQIALDRGPKPVRPSKDVPGKDASAKEATDRNGEEADQDVLRLGR